MPGGKGFVSKAQQRKIFQLEKEGKLPKGTAQKWAEETPNIKRLPEHIEEKSTRRIAKRTIRGR